jgi:hypothetical protein
MKIYRQGDVLFRSVNKAPSKGKKIRKDGIVAYGEATGHKHAVALRPGVEVFECGDDLFVSVSDAGIGIHGTVVTHDEHLPINLPAGNYQVTIQREYSPEAIRNVID